MTESKSKLKSRWRGLCSATLLLSLVGSGVAWADDDDEERDNGFAITSADWDSGDRELTVRGTGEPGRDVTVFNAFDLDQRIGSDDVGSRGTWRERDERPSPVPCRVRAVQDDGQVDERDVSNAPDNCAPKGGTEPPPPPVAECNISVSPTTIAFGDVQIDSSASRSVSVSNAGQSTCAVNVGISGGEFSAAPTSFNVNAAGSAAIAVTYAPGSAGPDIGSLTVNSDDPDTPTVTVDLSGNGVENQPPPPPPQACDPMGNGSHAGCFDAYTGPQVCVACHEGQARDMHGSVHYQQGGAFPNVTNIPLDFAAAGERPAQAASDLVATGVNTYCGTHENSPRFTCAGCHVGNGRFPLAQSEFEQLNPTDQLTELANIDCLTCHQNLYKRFPDWTASGEGFVDFDLLNLVEDTTTGELTQVNGAILPRTGFSGIPAVDPVTLDFQFLPAGSDTLPASVPMAPMSITTLQAAQTVHPTTPQTCLSCHAGAAGADGAKRGDLSREVANNASLAMDFHLSPQGAGLNCSSCHDAGGHRLRGRGLDLRPNDVPERFTCDSAGCHNSTPHGDLSNTQGSSRDKHAMKVACQTCHVPSYAKAAVGTEVARDWQDPHPTAAACNGRGGWLPREDKGGLGSASLIPSYAWFDGTSEVYYLGESLEGVPTIPLAADIAARFVGNFNAGDPAYVLGMPNGDVTGNTETKIYPMKEHWGKLAINEATNELIGHSTFEFFRTGSFCRAVAVGLGLDEENQATSSVCNGNPGDPNDMPPNTTTVAVHTFQTINHGVEPRGNALDCGSCHASQSGGPLQMELGSLGYGPRTLPSVVTGTNRTTLNGDLNNICSQCHGNETGGRGFDSVHSRHVQSLRRDCAACHNFSRPERGLSLNN